MEYTAEQVLEAVRAEATAFGRCCDCYQDGMGTFCCHECGMKTMAMLNGVQLVLGVHPKGGKPLSKMETDEARSEALVRRAAPFLLAACKDILGFLKANGYDTRIVKAAIAKATGGEG